LINVLDDIANNCPRCSALAVLPELTAGGSCLAGRNLDYPLFIRELVELQLLLVMQPDEGLPVVSLAWPGYVGVCTGMNRAGVSLSQLSAMSRECSLRGLPAALRFRQALMEAETLGGVATRILQAPATIGNNVLLAGPQEAAVLELSARRGVVRRPQEGLITVTNHYQTAAMEKVKGRFPRRPPGAALSAYHFSEAYSRAREARLQELAVGRRLDAAGLQGVLADAQVANAGTVVSVVYAPGDVKMWVARGQTAPVNQGPFMEVAPWA
jgi:hypothetical protein